MTIIQRSFRWSCIIKDSLNNCLNWSTISPLAYMSRCFVKANSYRSSFPKSLNDESLVLCLLPTALIKPRHNTLYYHEEFPEASPEDEVLGNQAGKTLCRIWGWNGQPLVWARLPRIACTHLSGFCPSEMWSAVWEKWLKGNRPGSRGRTRIPLAGSPSVCCLTSQRTTDFCKWTGILCPVGIPCSVSSCSVSKQGPDLKACPQMPTSIVVMSWHVLTHSQNSSTFSFLPKGFRNTTLLKGKTNQ